MSKVYTFASAGQNEVMDNLVAVFSEIVDERKSKNFVNNDSYKEKNKAFSEALLKYCFEESGKEYTGLDMVKNPMNVNRTSFKETFDTVIAQVITPVMPKLTSERYASLFDVDQVGFGDNAKYEVDSNELFIISEAAEGIARGGIQTLYNTEYTVRATKRTVTVGLDWYHVAAGVQDWGLWGMKLSKSFEAYIIAAVVKALTSVVSTAEGRTAHGIGGYFANGIDDKNWIQLRQNVSYANGGVPVYALGTSVGLGDILPSSEMGFRFGSDDPYVTVGHLPTYKDVPLIEVDNALIPNTINNTPVSLIDDNYIYMIAMGSHRPVKVVFEGNQVTVANDPIQSKDNTYAMTIDMRIGVDVIAGSKFGVIIKE